MRPKRVLSRAAIALLAVILIVVGAQALRVPTTDADDVKDADEVVRGTITDIASRWNDDRTHIVTTATVTVTSRLKGEGPETFTLAALGGTADGITEWAEDEPVLVEGSEAYVYVRRNVSLGVTADGRAQKIVIVGNGTVPGMSVQKDAGIPVEDYDRYLRDLAEGRNASVPEPVEPILLAAGATAAKPVVSSVSPSAGSAGTGTAITITGTGFGTKASRDSYADVVFLYKQVSPDEYIPIYASGFSGEKNYSYSLNPNDIVSWTDTRIVARIPVGRTGDRYWGSACSGFVAVLTDDYRESVKVPFTVTFGYGQQKWDGPAGYYVNPGSIPGAADAIRRAGDTWNAAVPSSSFRFEFQGTTASTVDPGRKEDNRDGKNVICFSDAPLYSDPDMIIGQTHIWLDDDGTVLEADIVLNTACCWTTGTAYGEQKNVQTVILHELGHWAGLTDLYGTFPGYPSDVGKVMFGYGDAEYGHLNQVTLHAADVAGIRWIYSGSGPSNASSGSEIEQAIVTLANQERQERGIPALRWDAALASIARAHSRDMAENGYFSLVNPRGQDFLARATAAGYEVRDDVFGENIDKLPTGPVAEYGYVDKDDPRSVARALVWFWMDDQDTRDILLDRAFARTGVGVAFDGRYYLVTQDSTL